MNRIIIAVVVLLTLVGCAANIKPTEGNQIVTNVLVKVPPEQAYQNLVRAAKDKCYPLTVDAQFYQTNNSGDVSFISQFDAVNRIVWMVFTIKPHNEGAAVSMAYMGRKNEFIEPSIKWLNGQDAKCPVS